VNNLIEAVVPVMLIAAAESGAYVLVHVVTIQRPFLTLKQFAIDLFGALLCFSLSFGLAGYLMCNAFLSLDLRVIVTIISVMVFPPVCLQRVAKQAKMYKAETRQQIHRKPSKKQQSDQRRYFYT